MLDGGCWVKATEVGAVIVTVAVAELAGREGLRSYACEVAVIVTELFIGSVEGAV
jgi:hypothetical protein